MMDTAEELAGAKATIAHMSEAMGWTSGHDRQGLDHLQDATRLAEQVDVIRKYLSEVNEDTSWFCIVDDITAILDAG